MAMDYAAKKAAKPGLLKGASAEQKKAINYFIPNDGCLASFFGATSDSEYEDIVKKLVEDNKTYEKALAKIGLDEDELKEIPPVTLWGYENSDFTRTTVGGSFRSNLYSVTHLFFSATQVYMYKITLNTMKNEKKERTEEYFYKDITNFSTSTESYETLKMGKGCFGKMQKISVEIQEFALIVPGDRFSCATYGDIEASVKAMKNKLREKKQ